MQIKKCTSLFLALLLLISNFGLAFNVHYCNDKIESFSSVFPSISQNNTTDFSLKRCCCVEDLSKNSCCENKVVDLKKESKDVITKSFSFQIDASFLITIASDSISNRSVKSFSPQSFTKYYCIANAPPLFKLYSQYIFYA